MKLWFPISVVVLASGMTLRSAEPPPVERSAVERGREALLTRSFSPPIVSLKGYDNLWKQWGMKEKPTDYPAALRDHYGVQPACYDNHGRPMGLRDAKMLFSKGVGVDCMLCHCGRVAGQSYFGLGNAALDLEALLTDAAAAEGFREAMPFHLSNVRGTVEAVASTAFLLDFRNADLSLRKPVKFRYRDDLCEDVPAWWLLKKKKTMYATGSMDARAVRSLMAFTLNPVNSGDTVKREESTFRDIRAFLLSLEAPRYPFPVDRSLAEKGEELFEQSCVRCHGVYGPGASYPNKIVPLETIGTDATLAASELFEVGEHFNRSWFGGEMGPDGKTFQGVRNDGYQAPPLDGIWATAPYFHNGSAPTLAHVLNSKSRPKVFTRSYGTEKEDYDPIHVGLKITVLQGGPDPKMPAIELRNIYDTTKPGRGNGGHMFGDKFTEEERAAVIEYLKTL